MHSRRRSDEEGEGQPEQPFVDYHPQATEELIEAAQFLRIVPKWVGYKISQCC